MNRLVADTDLRRFVAIVKKYSARERARHEQNQRRVQEWVAAQRKKAYEETKAQLQQRFTAELVEAQRRLRNELTQEITAEVREQMLRATVAVQQPGASPDELVDVPSSEEVREFVGQGDGATPRKTVRMLRKGNVVFGLSPHGISLMKKVPEPIASPAQGVHEVQAHLEPANSRLWSWLLGDAAVKCVCGACNSSLGAALRDRKGVTR